MQYIFAATGLLLCLVKYNPTIKSADVTLQLSERRGRGGDRSSKRSCGSSRTYINAWERGRTAVHAQKSYELVYGGEDNAPD